MPGRTNSGCRCAKNVLQINFRAEACAPRAVGLVVDTRVGSLKPGASTDNSQVEHPPVDGIHMINQTGGCGGDGRLERFAQPWGIPLIQLQAKMGRNEMIL